jgi:hypothetical protein
MKPGGFKYPVEIFAYSVKDQNDNLIEIRGYYM